MPAKKAKSKAKATKKQAKNTQSGFIENEFLILSIVAAGGLLSTIALVVSV
jgi:hypothetical protein